MSPKEIADELISEQEVIKIPDKLSFEDQIKTSLDDILSETSTQDIIKTCMQTAIKDAITKSFNYGALSKAVNQKIEEVLVPYIESYDMQQFIPKLDTILTDIINNTTLADNKKLLENFKGLMTEIEEAYMTLETVFKEYCKYVAREVSTSDLDVVYDNGEPEYESVYCKCEIEDISNEYSGYERIQVTFITEDAESQYGNSLNFTFILRRWKEQTEIRYNLYCDIDPSIKSLKYLSDFEIYLMNLTRNSIQITDITDIEEYVTPDAEPEATYS